jgi:hypothetical protein
MTHPRISLLTTCTSIVAALLVAGCAGTGAGSHKPGGNGKADGYGDAQRGDACGDDVTIQRQCADGLICVFPSPGNGPISEHTPGVCMTESELGEACGDDVAIQRHCADGLICVLPSDGPISEHTPGTCMTESEQGEPCGDDVAIQRHCADGLTCVPPTTGPISEHTPGTCEPQ